MMRRQVRKTTQQQQQEVLHTSSPPTPALALSDKNEVTSAGARLSSMRMLPPARSVSPSQAASVASSAARRSPSSTSAGVGGGSRVGLGAGANKCLPSTAASSRVSLRETTAVRGVSSANSSKQATGGGGGSGAAKKNTRTDKKPIVNITSADTVDTERKQQQQQHSSTTTSGEAAKTTRLSCGTKRSRSSETITPDTSSSLITPCADGTARRIEGEREEDEDEEEATYIDDDVRAANREKQAPDGTDSSSVYRDNRSFESCASASTYQHSASLFQQQQLQEKEDADKDDASGCSIAVPVVLKNDIKSGGDDGAEKSCSPSSRGGRPTATPLRWDASGDGGKDGVLEGRMWSMKDRDDAKKKGSEGEAAIIMEVASTLPQYTNNNFSSLSFDQRKQLIALLLLSQGDELTNSGHSTASHPPNDDDNDDKKNNSISNNTNTNTNKEVNSIDNRNNIRLSRRYQDDDAEKAKEKVHRLLLAGADNKRGEGGGGEALPLAVQMIEETLSLLKPLLIGAHGSYGRAGEDSDDSNNNNCIKRVSASEREALLSLSSSSSSSSSPSASSAPLQASILNPSFVVPRLLKEIDSLQAQLKKKAEEMENVAQENEHYKTFFRIISESTNNGPSGKAVEGVTDETRRSEATNNITSKIPLPAGRPVSIRLEDSVHSRSSLLGCVPCSSLLASTTTSAPSNARFSLLTNRGVAAVGVPSGGSSSSTSITATNATIVSHSPIKFKSLEAARAARRAVSFLLPSLTRTNRTATKGDGVNSTHANEEEEGVVEDEGVGKENQQEQSMSVVTAATGKTRGFQSESLHIDQQVQGIDSFDSAEGVQQRGSAGDWVGSDLSVSFAFRTSESGANATSPVPSSKRYRSEGPTASSAHMTPLEKARAANFQLRRSMNL